MHDKLAGRKKGNSENSEMSRKYNSMDKQTLEPVFSLGIFVNTWKSGIWYYMSCSGEWKRKAGG